MELKQGVNFEKHFHGHGKATGTLSKKEDIQSSLYPGEDRVLNEVHRISGIKKP